MNEAKLILLGCPIVLASMLLLTNTAQATEVVKTTNTVESASDQPIFEVEFVAQTPANPTSQLTNQKSDDAIANAECGCGSPTLEFTDAESDAAIERYGCDCAGCINAVRYLQGKLPLL